MLSCYHRHRNHKESQPFGFNKLPKPLAVEQNLYSGFGTTSFPDNKYFLFFIIILIVVVVLFQRGFTNSCSNTISTSFKEIVYFGSSSAQAPMWHVKRNQTFWMPWHQCLSGMTTDDVGAHPKIINEIGATTSNDMWSSVSRREEHINTFSEELV